MEELLGEECKDFDKNDSFYCVKDNAPFDRKVADTSNIFKFVSNGKYASQLFSDIISYLIKWRSKLQWIETYIWKFVDYYNINNNTKLCKSNLMEDVLISRIQTAIFEQVEFLHGEDTLQSDNFESLLLLLTSVFSDDYNDNPTIDLQFLSSKVKLCNIPVSKLEAINWAYWIWGCTDDFWVINQGLLCWYAEWYTLLLKTHIMIQILDYFINIFKSF